MNPARTLVALSLGAFVAWGQPRSAAAGQATIFVNYGGGDGFCNVCGANDYTINSFGSWAGGVRTFVDPSPPGAVVVQLVANVQGTCDSNNTLTVADATIGTSSFSGTGCACDSCFDGTVATGATYDAGWPGYALGATNSITISQDQAGAIDGVDLTVVWRLCGDGAVDPGEACDTGGNSPSCDADCTPAVCGDGTRNAEAGELCDEGGVTTATCNADCTLPECGDGVINPAAGEECDEGGGASATCNVDCTLPECGDGLANPAAGESCDDGGESASCDADCSSASCGDGTVNPTAGEACDDGNTASGDGCSAECDEEAAAGAGGAGTGGEGASGPSSGPGSGSGGDAGVGEASGAGGDASGGASGDSGEGGAGAGGPAASPGDGGCGCVAAGLEPAPDPRRFAGTCGAGLALAGLVSFRRIRGARGHRRRVIEEGRQEGFV